MFQNTFLDDRLLNQVVELVAPIVQAKAQATGRKGAAIVIPDPLVKNIRSDSLFQVTIGDLSKEEQGKYNRIATRKAAWCVDEQKDTSEILKNPMLLRVGDTHWPGGIYRDGLVVATSGLEYEDDVAVSEIFASLVLCEMRKIGQRLRDDKVAIIE